MYSVQRFTCVYFYALTAVDADEICTCLMFTMFVLINEKRKKIPLEDLQFEPHTRLKMVQVLGSALFICDICPALSWAKWTAYYRLPLTPIDFDN